MQKLKQLLSALFQFDVAFFNTFKISPLPKLLWQGKSRIFVGFSMSANIMRVKIEQSEDGEYYFSIPDELQKNLSWGEGDLIEWVDNGNGSWTLNKLSQLDTLKLKAFETQGVKAEYDRLSDDSEFDI
ncbi:hypothetical protein [Vibrio sp. SCSIO 43169]|uniref:hypothetical protein n=1 Tax=Vibrio sp. SCSIO 43169 TaxID=2822801 RepID=UPI002044508F|nr:hypothetical protein [Vibrio sp. SCSIO 43169]